MDKKEQEAAERAELVAKHGAEIVAHKSSFGWLVFGMPDADTYDDFTNEVSRDNGNRSSALRELCIRAAIDGEMRDTCRNVFKKRPGLPAIIAPQLIALASDNAAAAGKD